MAPLMPVEWIPWLMLLNFAAGCAYLATRDFIAQSDKWADIPIIAITFFTSTAFLIAYPIAGQFVIFSNGPTAVFPELGLFYFVQGLLGIGYTAYTCGYFIYLKLGWFEGLFAGRVRG
jgi:hypothetical protein